MFFSSTLLLPLCQHTHSQGTLSLIKIADHLSSKYIGKDARNHYDKKYYYYESLPHPSNDVAQDKIAEKYMFPFMVELHEDQAGKAPNGSKDAKEDSNTKERKASYKKDSI